MKRTPQPENPQQGKAYWYHDGKPYVAGLVNPCRVRLDPLFRKKREIISRLHDTRRTIYSRAPSISVAAGVKLFPAVVR